LSLSDVSYFLQQPKAGTMLDTAPISVAILMDYLENNKVKEALNPYAGAGKKADIMNNRVLLGNRDLTNSCYSRSLILLMDIKFALNEQFEDGKTFDGLLHSENIYVMPREIKYENFINEGYEAIKRKKLGLTAEKD
jgi:hypothetical protein